MCVCVDEFPIISSLSLFATALCKCAKNRVVEAIHSYLYTEEKVSALI